MARTLPDILNAAQARQLLAADADVEFVDVRTPAEFGPLHIPGSRNVPLHALRKRGAGLVTGHAGHIVLVCASGPRATRARDQLRAAGVDKVSVLDGGITAWQRDGGPVSHGSTATWSMERQVRLVAGMLVLTGVLVSTVYEPLKWLAGFVGAGLTFAGLTNTCGLARLLALLPYNRSQQCELGASQAVSVAPAAQDVA